LRSRKTKNNRFITIATTVGIVAVTVAVAVGLTGWPPARAGAAPAPTTPTLFGVDESTAVVLGPQVLAAEKFGSAIATPATSAAVASLVAPAAKRTATIAPKKAAKVASKPAKRAAKPKPVAKRAAAKGSWRSARVSWYGPGLYGNGMAGGGKLKRDSMVVAHRSLPFGTRIQFKYKGRTVTAVVKDRGPYIKGRTFDLGPGTAKALHFSGVGTVKYRIVR